MSEINWPITTEVPVLWGDMDDFGHVNNIIYTKWCETSRIELFLKLWNIDVKDIQSYINSEGKGPILANINMNYKIPIKYPDIIFVKSRISSIGNTSFGVSHELFSENNGDRIVAFADSIVVMIDYVEGKKIKIDKNTFKKLSLLM